MLRQQPATQLKSHKLQIKHISFPSNVIFLPNLQTRSHVLSCTFKQTCWPPRNIALPMSVCWLNMCKCHFGRFRCWSSSYSSTALLPKHCLPISCFCVLLLTERKKTISPNTIFLPKLWFQLDLMIELIHSNRMNFLVLNVSINYITLFKKLLN